MDGLFNLETISLFIFLFILETISFVVQKLFSFMQFHLLSLFS
jgi:hypothetical protein